MTKLRNENVFLPTTECFKSTYQPKSSGNDVNDISFNPNTVRLLSWENPTGRRGIGFELKSATCRLPKCLISSGMSEISGNKKEKKISYINIFKKLSDEIFF